MAYSIWTVFYFVTILLMSTIESAHCQPPPNVIAGGAPPPLPPGRGYQLPCSGQYAYEDQTDPAFVAQFTANAFPGYDVVSVEPCIFPGKNAHRFIVKYRSHGPRRCGQITSVKNDMNNYKPQNTNVGDIAVVRGGFIVAYYKYCMCLRGSYRRRRSNWFSREHNDIHLLNSTLPHGYYFTPPRNSQSGYTMRCDDQDQSCGFQSFIELYPKLILPTSAKFSKTSIVFSTSVCFISVEFREQALCLGSELRDSLISQQIQYPYHPYGFLNKTVELENIQYNKELENTNGKKTSIFIVKISCAPGKSNGKLIQYHINQL